MFDTKQLNEQTGWTAKQRNHLRRLIKSGAVIAYVCTDRFGRPSNGGPATMEWQVRPGLVQELMGPLKLCEAGTLHGTFEPHRWAGDRVWVAGFVGKVARESNKIGGLRREIVGEVYPECAMSPSVGARLGRKDLQCANLQSADLRSANLQSANLQTANLWSADLRSANLWSADLRSANLWSADLRSADLRSANLRSANLQCANLQSADLRSADLQAADLQSANLQSANLQAADLQSANLQTANLWSANLYMAFCPNGKNIPEIVATGYEPDANGYLVKK